MKKDPTFLELIATLVQNGNSLVARDIVKVIGDELDAGGDPLPWIDAVATVRDTGAMSDDAAYYLIDFIAEAASLHDLDHDETIQNLTRRMEVIERREGLTEDEAFPLGKGPPDYEELSAAWNARHDSIIAAILREAGEVQMALAVLRDDDEHRGRSASGWRELMAMDDDDSTPFTPTA